MKTERARQALAVIVVVILATAAVAAWGRLGGDFWPPDRSTVGPNLVAGLIQWAVVLVVVTLLYPPLRRAIGRFFDRRLLDPIAEHFAALHIRHDEAHSERAELHDRTSEALVTLHARVEGLHARHDEAAADRAELRHALGLGDAPKETATAAKPPEGHILRRRLDEYVAYPPHPPRRSSPIYVQTHRHLIYDLDAPCWVCGIRRSAGGAMETHHYRFEWASQFGLDLAKVTADFPDLTDRAKLAEWVDSEGNMLVLCATHHRSKYEGIHMVTYPAWLLQRYQGDEWKFIEEHTALRAFAPLFAHEDSK